MQRKLLTNGNIFKRTDGRWNGVVWYSDEQGAKKRKSFCGTTKQEVKGKLSAYLADFDRQRGELQQYVTREREALVEQLRATGDELVRTTLDAVPGLVGKILLYVVLALAVLIGGPFALGFWLGGVRAKARIKNEKLKMKN